MYYLVYVSTAIELFNDDALVEILNTSRTNNTEHNITGVLLYGEGTFIQLLEGEEHDVEYIYHRIQRDGRHKNLITLLRGTEDERTFPDWAMGFKSVDAMQLKQLKGFINPKELSVDPENAHPPYVMLRTFFETSILPR